MFANIFQSETKIESFGFVEVRKAKLQYLILLGWECTAISGQLGVGELAFGN